MHLNICKKKLCYNETMPNKLLVFMSGHHTVYK